MRRFLALAISFIVIAALCVSRSAADAAPQSPPSDYHFGPGDVIDVTVSPQHTFDRMVTIQPDGKISFPIVGQLQASGLTVDQLVRKLQTGLNRDLVDPQVTITMRESGKRELGHVSVLGAVHSEGGFEMRQGSTVLDALAAVGGPTTAADLRQVTITRADGKVSTLDIAQAERTGRTDQDISLQPGDRIFVPEGPSRTVLVLGNVAKPGPYEIQRDAHLMDAIALAGGPTEKADLSRVTLTHPGVPGVQTLDLRPLLVQGNTNNSALNPPVQPGDSIFIPEAQKVKVVGNVTKPDVYALKPNDRVLDVLLEAGGAGSGVTQAVLLRRGPDGKPVSRKLNLKKIMVNGDDSENVLMQPGDVLWVADKRSAHKFGIGDITPLFYLLTVF